MIHIYCGDGKGKTTAAIGLAVRMAGYGKKVLFMQFMKGSNTGELKLLSEAGNITVMRCDRNYGFFKSMDETDKGHITRSHNDNLKYVIWNMEQFDMIVLDEIFAAYNTDLADKEMIATIIADYKGELVLTGRKPPQWISEKADYISEVKKIKHPFDMGIKAREGIEY